MKTNALTLATFLFPLALQAQTEGLISAEIVQGGRDKDGSPLAAVVLNLQPGWKTYWRSPGDGGGIPPQIDWTGSQNLAAAKVMWPAPEVWGDVGMTNIGYHNTMILPLALARENPALPISVRAEVSFGICKDICVPALAVLNAEVSGDAPQNPQIALAMAHLPQPAVALGAKDIACLTAPIKDGVRVTVTLTFPHMAQGAAETVVIEHADREVWASGAQMARQDNVITATADLVPPSAQPFDVAGADLRITILSNKKAAEVIGCPVN